MNAHDCHDQQGWQDTLHAAVSDWIRRYSEEHELWEAGQL
jgi:hypothetical protein